MYDEIRKAVLAYRIEERRQFMEAGLGSIDADWTEDEIDELGDRFVRLQIREITGISFEQYLGAPEYFEIFAGIIKKEWAMTGGTRPRQITDAGSRFVEWETFWAPEIAKAYGLSFVQRTLEDIQRSGACTDRT
ncbi:MAG: hypothetical protein ABSF90_10490 [Syntrophobacteraceae bacterium]|jgi:hypothetical protein